MKTERIGIKLSQKRLERLKAYTEAKDKTMTQVIEELIDGLILEA
jgi:hypothetical protein